MTEIVNLQQRLQSLVAIEAEIVETETWNFDASVLLSIVADQLGGIPFGTPQDFYDLQPTYEEKPSQCKGKGKEKDSTGETSPQSAKRALLHVDPKQFQDSWWATSLRKSLNVDKTGLSRLLFFCFF